MKKIILILLLILVSGCLVGEGTRVILREGPFKVTNIVDGDTLDIETGSRIRLSGINTPEKGECYYEEAKEALERLTLDEEIYLERDISNLGKYGRFLRYVYIDGLFVNSYLVERGFARVYDKYADDTKYYEKLKEKEKIAIKNHLGVWACS